jgi:hypothetical protein
MAIVGRGEVIAITLGTGRSQDENVSISLCGIDPKVLNLFEDIFAIGGRRYLIETIKDEEPGIEGKPVPDLVRRDFPVGATLYLPGNKSKKRQVMIRIEGVGEFTESYAYREAPRFRRRYGGTGSALLLKSGEGLADLRW